MILDQYYLSCLAHASYLVGDEETRTAAIVDPQRDIDQYLVAAGEYGLQIRYVFLTHFHADFLAGHLELRDRAGATICLGPHAEAEYAFRRFADGEILEFGQVRLQVLATPGHTPESACFLVHDLARSAEAPHAVLTGDTLFIGDVGRPDLFGLVGVTAEELASQLYDSLRQRLLPLPEETLVYPAHGAGSLCGRNLSDETVSTMGVQRQYNYALQPMDREVFVRLVTADQPDAPDYFSYDAVLNRKERKTLEETLHEELKPVELDRALALAAEGTQLLDVRNGADFEGGHLLGTTNIALDGKYATWAGTLLSREAPILIIADPGREEEAAMRLGRIGFDNVAGYLADGMGALEDRDELLGRTERIAAATLAEHLELEDAPCIVDVRAPQEWAAGHIPGSLNIPLNHLRERVAQVPTDRAVVVCCDGGYRSAVAASLLAQCGPGEAADLVGGVSAWAATGLPVATAAPQPD